MFLGVFPSMVERFFGEGLLVLAMSGNRRGGQTGTNATSRTVIPGTLRDCGRTEAQPGRFYMRKSARRNGTRREIMGGHPSHAEYAQLP